MRRWCLLIVLLLAACGQAEQPQRAIPTNSLVVPPTDGPKPDTTGHQNAAFKILVFSKTNGYEHPSIPSAITATLELGAANNFSVDATEDASAFTDANLAQYAAVVFLMTSGNNILNADQKAAFQRYIEAGNGYAGIHSASDTEYQWAWYGGLVGAYFNGHPTGNDQFQTATLHVEDANHPSTDFLGATWVREDEWYNFDPNPRANVNVLLSLDESTYTGGTMNGDHPIAWYHAYDGGRAWYTAGGHKSKYYAEPLFRQHILGGILYAAGVAPAPTVTPTASSTNTPPVTPTFPPTPTTPSASPSPLPATPTSSLSPTLTSVPTATQSAPSGSVLWLPLVVR